MINIVQALIMAISITVFAFSQVDCETYYADIDGDGDGAKSIWCSYTELFHYVGDNWEDSNWETNGCGTVGWNGSTPEGHLTYGPYISSDPGPTNVTWNLLANGDTNNDGTQIATIDIFDVTSQELLAWQNISVSDFSANMTWQDFSLSYYSSPDHIYEFRTWYNGQGGHLVLRYITQINVEADAQGAYGTAEFCEGDDTSGWSLNTNDLMPLCAGNSNDVCWDCAGIWGGSSVNDECGVCSGDNSACADCAGIPNGDAVLDNCDMCDADASNDCVQDCAGIWGGSLVNDECGVCNGDGSSCACSSGDVNNDDSIDVIDIIAIVDHILYLTEINCADINGDGIINIMDIIALVDVIVGGRFDNATSAQLYDANNSMSIDANGYIGGIQMTLNHGDDFSIELTKDALVANYNTIDNQTVLVIVVPAGNELFTYTGNFEIVDIIIANSHSEVRTMMVEKFNLSNAYPNPFNPSTTVELSLPEAGAVSVMVYNLNGQLMDVLENRHMSAGWYQFTWNASYAPSGIYLIQTEYAGSVSTQKVMLLK